MGFGLLNPIVYADPTEFTDVTGNGAEVGNARVDFVNSVDATKGLSYTFVDFNHDSSLTVGLCSSPSLLEPFSAPACAQFLS